MKNFSKNNFKLSKMIMSISKGKVKITKMTVKRKIKNSGSSNINWKKLKEN